MKRSEIEFLNRVNRFWGYIKLQTIQFLCWHNWHDNLDIRTRQWGHVMEDKYTCTKCRRVMWMRRRRYVGGSWIKDSPG